MVTRGAGKAVNKSKFPCSVPTAICRASFKRMPRGVVPGGIFALSAPILGTILVGLFSWCICIPLFVWKLHLSKSKGFKSPSYGHSISNCFCVNNGPQYKMSPASPTHKRESEFLRCQYWRR